MSQTASTSPPASSHEFELVHAFYDALKRCWHADASCVALDAPGCRCGLTEAQAALAAALLHEGATPALQREALAEACEPGLAWAFEWADDVGYAPQELVPRATELALLFSSDTQ